MVTGPSRSYDDPPRPRPADPYDEPADAEATPDGADRRAGGNGVPSTTPALYGGGFRRGRDDDAGSLVPALAEDEFPPRLSYLESRESLWRLRSGGPGRGGGVGYRQTTHPDAWPVGFSPTGDALPDALISVLRRGSHAVRSAQRVEAERRRRAAAVAAHVEAQIAAFLDIAAQSGLQPPVKVRVVRDVPRLARVMHRGDGRPRAILRVDDAPHLAPVPALDAADRADDADAAAGGADEDGPAQLERGGGAGGNDGQANGSRRVGRPGRTRRFGWEHVRAWPLLHWRCESFPSAGRTLHLFVEPGGRTFEGRDDPAPLAVLGRRVRVWPVDAPSIVEGMAEVDARRCAVHLVDSMAQLLWRAGVGL